MMTRPAPPAFFHTPATDTAEIARVYRGNPPTVELHMLDLRPAITPTRRTRALRRHLRASIDAALTTAGIIAGLILVTRGAAFLAVILTSSHP